MSSPSSPGRDSVREEMFALLYARGALSEESEARLHAWASAEGEVRRLLDVLVSATLRNVERHILSYVRGECIQPLLEHCLFTDKHYSWTRALCANPDWSAAHSRYLVQRLLGRIQSCRAENARVAAQMTEQLAELDEEKRALVESDLEVLIRWAGGEEKAEKAMGEAEVAVASILLSRLGNRLGDRFLPLFEKWRVSVPGTLDENAMPPRIIASPHTPLEALRTLADASQYPYHYTHRALAKSERARRDPVVWKALLQSPDTVAVGILLDTLSDPNDLSQEDLALLLASPAPKVRLKAMTWWGAREIRSPEAESPARKAPTR